jgi:hypothetical protein
VAVEMPVQWTRGFFRLWIVIALFWAIGVASVALSEKAIPSWREGCEELSGFVEDKTGKALGDTDVEQCNNVWRAARLKWAGWFFGPPAGILIGGTLFGWIVSGFRPQKSN